MAIMPEITCKKLSITQVSQEKQGLSSQSFEELVFLEKYFLFFLKNFFVKICDLKAKTMSFFYI